MGTEIYKALTNYKALCLRLFMPFILIIFPKSYYTAYLQIMLVSEGLCDLLKSAKPVSGKRGIFIWICISDCIASRDLVQMIHKAPSSFDTLRVCKILLCMQLSTTPF